MLNPRAWGLGSAGGPFMPLALLDPITIAATVATVAGSVVSAAGTIAGGKAAQKSAEFEAAQLDVRAKDEMASGQREADQLARKKELALSTLQTNAAASGFSATDPDALAKADEIARYGTLQEKTALYGGESRRSSMEAQAEGRRYEGEVAKIGSRYKAAATILGGAATIADRYAPRPRSSAEGSGLRYG